MFSRKEIQEEKVHWRVDLESAVVHFPRHRTLSMSAPNALAVKAKEKIEDESSLGREQARVDFLALKRLPST